MNKKEFKGIDALLDGSSVPTAEATEQPTIEQPQAAQPRHRQPSSAKFIKPSEVRATFILEEELLNKVKGIAYYERTTIKEIVTAALDNYVKQYETEVGKIQTSPTKPRYYKKG